MTKKGFEVLKKLIRYQSFIAFVIIGKDMSIDNDFSEKIKSLYIDNNIDFYYREKKPEIDKRKFIIAVSWRWMISIQKKLIVFHYHILPKYRGFAPLVNMLIKGENKIGV